MKFRQNVNVTLFSFMAQNQKFDLKYATFQLLLRCNSYTIKFTKAFLSVKFSGFFLVYFQNCTTIIWFYNTPERSPACFRSNSPFYPIPSLQPLATTSLLCVSMNLPIRTIPHKWYHSVCGIL